MNGPRIGSLFTGSGQLDEAVRAVLGGTTVWVADVCKVDKGGAVGHYTPCRAPCSILAHHYPDAPNLGDIALVDWAAVEPIDILTLGFPCQDLSAAGKRLGLRPGTRSGLWSHAAYAISQLNPRLVVIENVRGLLSASAHSDVEPCAWCVGDPPDGALRALGAVLGDLADLGFDAEWVGLPASAVGAPHGRPREFVLAWSAADTGGEHGIERWIAASREAAGGRSLCEPAGRDRAPVTLLPTPDASAEKYRLAGDSQQSKSLAAMARRGDFLLPTPVTDPASGNGHARDLGAESRMLPTPTGVDAHHSGGGYNGQTNVTLTDATVRKPRDWGKYAAAVARWEQLTRPAPDPTEPAPKGGRRLSRYFDEWMMGWPAGWVTDVPGVTWNEAVKACGNGVVPQQAEAALRYLLPRVGTV